MALSHELPIYKQAYKLLDLSLDLTKNFPRDFKRKMGVPDWQVIISSDLKLRTDGLPLSGQREPDDQGVAVWWAEGDGHRVIALDKYHRIADNIYAVAKTIEALRGIERWGSGEILQRTFTGFTALPHLSTDTWWSVLGVQAHTPTAEVEAVYKSKRSAAHPDRLTGSVTEFNLVQEAWNAFQKERGLL
jgi:hypothetical protein